jgi:hypothetical protein
MLPTDCISLCEIWEYCVRFTSGWYWPNWGLDKVNTGINRHIQSGNKIARILPFTMENIVLRTQPTDLSSFLCAHSVMICASCGGSVEIRRSALFYHCLWGFFVPQPKYSMHFPPRHDANIIFSRT